MNNYYHSTGYLRKLHKNFMLPGSLLFPTNALPNSFHHYLLLVLITILAHFKQYCDSIYNISGIHSFGLSTTLLKYWTGYIRLIRPQELDDLIVMICYIISVRISYANALKNNIRSLVREALKIMGDEGQNT